MPLITLHPSPVELYLAADDGIGSTRLRTAATMLRVRFRVYARSAAWAKLHPWERYLSRVHAYALVSPGAVFCLESAAVLLGMPVFGEPRDIHTYAQGRATSTRYGDVVIHTSAQDRPLFAGTGGLRVTDPIQTALDLGRVLPPAFGLAVADSAARSSIDAAAAIAAFRRGVTEQISPRGRARLRWLADRIDAVPESPGESVSRAVIEWLGYPQPELQHTFRYEGITDRADFFWREYRAIGESDGWGKYEGTPEEVRERLRAEKVREDRLRRYERSFGRWDWRDTMRAEPLDRKLALMGLPVLARRNNAALTTLRSHSRSLSPS
ncbi:hypothetical protein ACFXP7_07935 [Microbacterium sp. P06]|uniref:hypothetical protein n=1 Tax=Microbacterium sp. P06 TaxID=3366949 RepID=UPI003745D366